MEVTDVVEESDDDMAGGGAEEKEEKEEEEEEEDRSSSNEAEEDEDNGSGPTRESAWLAVRGESRAVVERRAWHGCRGGAVGVGVGDVVGRKQQSTRQDDRREGVAGGS